MFKGMYDLIHKTKKKRVNEKVALQKDATPIFTPEELLNTEKRQQILQDIRSLLSLPDEEYDRIFLSVIHNFAAFIQNIPETERSYYSSLGGMLEHGLERASLSLFLCRTYLLPEGASLSSLSENEMLWVYAVFTAALLLDVGKIATRHVITLSDAEGNSLSSWLPYSGSMIGQGTHYIFEFAEDNTEHMRHLVTPLLARQILPADGFNWLASDADVLESWLSMLSDEKRGVGSLLTVIPLADAQLLESYFTDRKIFRHALSPQTIAFLNKLNKERKEVSQKLKELKEKMLIEQAQNVDKDKAANTQQSADQSKTTKQSLFGFPSVAQQDRENKALNPATVAAATVAVTLDSEAIRRNAEKFAQWMKDNIGLGKIVINDAKANIQVVDKNIMITHQLLQDYLNTNKNAEVRTINDLRAVLLQSELMRAVTPAEAMNFAATSSALSNISHVLIAQNPSLILPVGMAQTFQQQNTLATTQTVQQPITQQSQTAQQAYEQQQQKQQQQLQQQAIQENSRITPTPFPRGK